MVNPVESAEKGVLAKRELVRGHQPKYSEACIVKQLRSNGGFERLEFLVAFEKEGRERWAELSEVKRRAPTALCDYLLGKVKWGRK